MDSSTVAALTIAPPTISATTLLMQVATGSLDPMMAFLIFIFDKAPFFAIFAFSVIFFYRRVFKPMGDRITALFVKIEKLTNSLDCYVEDSKKVRKNMDTNLTQVKGIIGSRAADKIGAHRVDKRKDSNTVEERINEDR